MNEVFVSFNPYLPELKIQVNGRSLPEYSALIKYKHSPFVEWCEVFFDEIAKEVNDSYKLTFTGMQFEGDIMEKLADADALCESYSSDIPEFSEDVIERLTNLQQLGDIEKDSDLRIGIWSPSHNMADSFLEMLVEDDLFTSNDGVFISYDCPLVRLIVEQAQDLSDLKRNDLGFAFFEDIPSDPFLDEMKSLSKPLFAIIASGLTGFDGRYDGIYVFNTDGEDTTDLFFNLITSSALPGILSERCYSFEQMVSNGEVLLTDTESDILRNLCATWPQFRVVFPERMYVGRKSVIRIEGRGAEEGQNSFFVKSVRGLCETNGLEIKAMYPGIDELRAFNGLDPDPIGSTTIKITDKKVIEEIKVFPKVKYLPERAEGLIDVTIVPHDAANLNELKIEVANPEIVEIENEHVKGLSVGTTTVRFCTPDIEENIKIVVQPHISDIKIDSLNVNLKTGETIEWVPKPVPDDCFEKDMLRIVSSKDSVVTYRGGYLVAGTPGLATIVVSSPEGLIRKECRVEVKKAGLFR